MSETIGLVAEIRGPIRRVMVGGSADIRAKSPGAAFGRSRKNTLYVDGSKIN